MLLWSYAHISYAFSGSIISLRNWFPLIVYAECAIFGHYVRRVYLVQRIWVVIRFGRITRKHGIFFGIVLRSSNHDYSQTELFCIGTRPLVTVHGVLSDRNVRFDKLLWETWYLMGIGLSFLFKGNHSPDAGLGTNHLKDMRVSSVGLKISATCMKF